MNAWMLLWGAMWYAGLAAFAVLVVAVAIFGRQDLITLIGDLTRLHEGSENEPVTASED